MKRDLVMALEALEDERPERAAEILRDLIERVGQVEAELDAHQENHDADS